MDLRRAVTSHLQDREHAKVSKAVKEHPWGILFLPSCHAIPGHQHQWEGNTATSILEIQKCTTESQSISSGRRKCWKPKGCSPRGLLEISSFCSPSEAELIFPLCSLADSPAALINRDFCQCKSSVLSYNYFFSRFLLFLLGICQTGFPLPQKKKTPGRAGVIIFKFVKIGTSHCLEYITSNDAEWCCSAFKSCCVLS